ncbi:MAG: hypothetical protein CMD96_02140 [Gammaproteobacteria bacterium]|nr:hypothetical protein [Gammaproteobacteria bacterium]HJP19013.1 DUF1566 domain-containing protein [Nitrospinota bacterium]
MLNSIMGKRFYYNFLITLFLFSLFLAPQVSAEKELKREKNETQNIKKQIKLKGIRSKDGRFVDNENGTITDTKTNLMWAKTDSYSDLGNCLGWDESRKYVIRLSTGGYNDWRMPTVKELKSIFEKSKSNKDETGNAFHIDPIFAPGSGYWQWTSEEVGSCCARFMLFSNGDILEYTRECFFTGGVRAIRQDKR